MYIPKYDKQNYPLLKIGSKVCKLLTNQVLMQVNEKQIMFVKLWVPVGFRVQCQCGQIYS